MTCDKSRIESGFFQFREFRRHPLVFQERVEDLVVLGKDRDDLHPHVPALLDHPVVPFVFAAETAELLVFPAIELFPAFQALISPFGSDLVGHNRFFLARWAFAPVPPRNAKKHRQLFKILIPSIKYFCTKIKMKGSETVAIRRRFFCVRTKKDLRRIKNISFCAPPAVRPSRSPQNPVPLHRDPGRGRRPGTY